jgi:hypothetical protein
MKAFSILPLAPSGPAARPAATEAPWESLPPEFATWWWQPPATVGTQGHSLLSQRLASATQARVRRGFGEVLDWSWVSLALMPSLQRLECAALYAAMLPPRATVRAEHIHALDSMDCQWALSIGSIQPLPRHVDVTTAQHHAPALVGYAEVGIWVRADFPALWERLMHDMSDATRAHVAQLMADHSPRPACHDSQRQRVKRCWALAHHRTENRHGLHSRTALAA